MNAEVHIHPDAESAALAAAEGLVTAGRRAIAERGRFCVALSGGSTPKRMYELLGVGKSPGLALDWSRVHVFFCDERCVPPTHEASNYAMIRRSLLDHANTPESQVHRIEGELPASLAAGRYDDLLRCTLGRGQAWVTGGSTFDLVLLGVGEDGHTASLFPGGEALGERDRLAVPAQGPEGVAVRDRVTLTLPALGAAREVMFLVCGAGKAKIMRPLLAGKGDAAWPAGMVRGEGATQWHVDKDAAGS